jgi:hypothetical protein
MIHQQRHLHATPTVEGPKSLAQDRREDWVKGTRLHSERATMRTGVPCQKGELTAFTSIAGRPKSKYETISICPTRAASFMKV